MPANAVRRVAYLPPPPISSFTASVTQFYVNQDTTLTAVLPAQAW
jgi:hypothetical protein